VSSGNVYSTWEPVGSSRPIICSSSFSLLHHKNHFSHSAVGCFQNHSFTSIGCRANKSSPVICGSMKFGYRTTYRKDFSFRKLKAKTRWSCTLISERFRLHFLRNLYMMHLTRLRIFSFFHIRYPSNFFSVLLSSC
jgi:hypothetical protein